jgi:GntR family transcriptional regulator
VQRAAHVRLLDGKPIGYCETFIPSDLKIRFSPNELNTNPMLTLLERKGVDIGWGDQLIGATLADARFGQLLDVPVGSPLVRVRLVVFDTRQRPVERLVAYYRGDHYDHHIRLTRRGRR